MEPLTEQQARAIRKQNLDLFESVGQLAECGLHFGVCRIGTRIRRTVWKVEWNGVEAKRDKRLSWCAR